MTKKAIIVDNPSDGTLYILKKLKDSKDEVVNKMRDQRNLAINITER